LAAVSSPSKRKVYIRVTGAWQPSLPLRIIRAFKTVWNATSAGTGHSRISKMCCWITPPSASGGSSSSGRDCSNGFPPVWRRILVPGNTTLLKLHDILQIVMGWEDSHLHMFTIEGSIYGDPANDEYGDLGTIDEAKVKSHQVIYREGQRLSYEYDFGDSWNHTLLVEKFLPPQEGVRYPMCLKGERACPPEDVGGVWGYENFLEAIRNPLQAEFEPYTTFGIELRELSSFRISPFGKGLLEAINAAMKQEQP
jgi:hypothetical protein